MRVCPPCCWEGRESPARQRVGWKALAGLSGRKAFVISPPRASAFGLSPGLRSPGPLGRTGPAAQRLDANFPNTRSARRNAAQRTAPWFLITRPPFITKLTFSVWRMSCNARNRHEVGSLAGLEGADLVGEAEEVGAAGGGGEQRLGRGH